MILGQLVKTIYYRVMIHKHPYVAIHPLTPTQKYVRIGVQTPDIVFIHI